MNRETLTLRVGLLGLLLILSGCGRGTPPQAAQQGTNKPGAAAGGSSEEETEIKESLAKLSPADRKLAEAQRFCAVQGKKSRLGSMGTPVKLTLKGEPVFLCCGHCKKKAEEHPDETLARVKELKTPE